MAFTIEAVELEVHEHAQVTELEVGIDQGHPPLVLGGEGDGGVDRNRGVPDTTLGP